MFFICFYETPLTGKKRYISFDDYHFFVIFAVEYLSIWTVMYKLNLNNNKKL